GGAGGFPSRADGSVPEWSRNGARSGRFGPHPRRRAGRWVRAGSWCPSRATFGNCKSLSILSIVTAAGRHRFPASRIGRRVMRTKVVIIGSGPSGLLLGQLL